MLDIIPYPKTLLSLLTAGGFYFRNSIFKSKDVKVPKKITTFYMIGNKKKDSWFDVISGSNDEFTPTINSRTVTNFRIFMEQLDEDDDINIVIRTYGGQLSKQKIITDWLKMHKGKVTVIIPEYAYSSGTLVTLHADKLIMDKRAHLSPIDPQLSIGGLVSIPAFHFLDIVQQMQSNGRDASEVSLFFSKMAENLVSYMKGLFRDANFLQESIFNGDKDILKEQFTQKHDHCHVFSVPELQELGFIIDTEIPEEIRTKYNQIKKLKT